MLRQELKKQLIKNRLALLLVAAIAIDALLSLFSSVKPNYGLVGFAYMWDYTYHSAWNMFLNGSSLNWALLIFICVAVLRIWVDEYRLNMQVYNLTSANGRAGLAAKKAMITFGLVLPAAVISEFLRILMYGINLSYNNLPLNQCGLEYATADPALTASQTCFISIPLHILGYLLFCSLCILATVIIRNSVNCLGVCFAVLFIPLYVFDDLDVRLRLPFPITLLQGEKMFYGSMIDSKTENTENPLYYFKAPDQGEILLNVILALLITAAAISLSIVIFAGKGRKKKKGKAVILPLAAIMLFSGCSSGGSVLPKAEESGYIYIDTEYVYSKERDEVFSINPTPLSNRRIQQIYGNYAIVMEYVNDIASEAYYIKAIDLDDLSETLLYVFGMESDDEGLMGLDDVINIPSSLLYDFDFSGYSTNFRFADNKLYFDGSEHYLCVDLSDGTKTYVLENIEFTDQTITDDGIYYKGEDGMLYLNGEDTRICDFPIGAYIVGNGAIAVVNKEDNCPYLITSEGIRKISDTKVYYFYYTSNNVTVFESADYNEVAVIGDSEITYDRFVFYADDDGVYFWDWESETMEFRSY